MEPGKKGTKVRVRDARPFDDYQQGQELIVEVIDDSDGTFRGRDMATGKMGGWLSWGQVDEVGGGVAWDFLKGVLTPETVQLLSAFEGLERLKLRTEVADTILLGVPDLEARIREVADQKRPGRARLRSRRRPFEELAQSELRASLRPPAPGPTDDAEEQTSHDEDLPDDTSDSDVEGEGGWLEDQQLDLGSMNDLEDLSDRIQPSRRQQKEA